MSDHFECANYHLLTGAPGCGKTSVLKVLQQQGCHIMPEAARQVIAEQRAIDGEGVYDKNPGLFKELMLSRAIAHYQQAEQFTGPVLFDRGIPDLLAYSDCFDLPHGAEVDAAKHWRYNNTVFFLPSWREIFVNDEERRLSFEAAEEFGQQLKQHYQELGYQLLEVPKVSIAERADFILQHINKEKA